MVGHRTGTSGATGNRDVTSLGSAPNPQRPQSRRLSSESAQAEGANARVIGAWVRAQLGGSMIKNVRKRSLVAAAALFLVAGPLTGTAVGQDSELDLRDAGQPARVQAASTDADLDALTLPIVSEQMARLASDLMETFGEDPNFASAEVTRDRSSLIVHWHGSPSSEVLAAVGSEPTVNTVFQATKFSPGALRSAAQALLSDDRSVKGVEVAHDGSGLRALVEQAQAGPTQSRSTAASRLSTAAGFPVSVDYTAVVPASTRQNDLNYHLGGVRVYRFDGAFITGGCTTGFSVVKQGDTSQQGMMFAAHCGSVGDQFITSDGTFAYTYGNITPSVDTTNDGAIIDSGWSQPFIWTSTWDSSVYTRINGVASPYVGQELCYSLSLIHISEPTR